MVRIRAMTGRRRSEIAEDSKSDRNGRKKQADSQTLENQIGGTLYSFLIQSSAEHSRQRSEPKQLSTNYTSKSLNPLRVRDFFFLRKRV